MVCIRVYNIGKYIVDKFTKLSKTVFPMEFFSTDISQYSSANVKILWVAVLVLTISFLAFQK